MMIIFPCSAISQEPSQSNESFIKDQGCVNRTPDQDKTRVRIKDIKWQQGKPKNLREDKLRCHIMHHEFHMKTFSITSAASGENYNFNDTRLYQDNNKSKNNYYLLDFLYSFLWTEENSVRVTRNSTCRQGSMYDISRLSSGLSCILDCVQFCLTSPVSLSSSLQTERDDI